MDIKLQLKQIQHWAGISQVDLAKQLEVSFVTINSWMNGKSMPRAGAVDKIQKLHTKYSGKGDSFLADIDKKCTYIDFLIKHNRSTLSKGMISFILKHNDVFEEFALKITYHSNSIEGSTLTMEDTADIIFNNAVIPNKTLNEHLEARNHRKALFFLFEQLELGVGITVEFINKLHSILMAGILDTAGTYRNHPVRIVGSFVPTANHLKIPELMGSLENKILESCKKSKNKSAQSVRDLVVSIVEVHAIFEKIHPYADGNGRVGRLLMIAMLIKNNIPPAIITQETKRLYYNYLSVAQIEEKYEALTSYATDAILNGFAVLEKLD